MKILVTGANGFIGGALCQHLAASGQQVVPVVRRPCDVPDARILMADDDDAAWSAVLAGCDSVVHLAARAHVMHEHERDPLQAFRAVNVDMTLQLARRAAAAGVRRFVFMSTIKVNGEASVSGSPFGADDLPAPQDSYAASKQEAEAGLLGIARDTGLEVVIIRPPLVYGPGVKGNFASLIRWVRKGVPLPLGAVNNQRSLVAVDNLVDLVACVADRKNTPQAVNQVFLVSDGEDLATPELLRKIALAYRVPVRLIPVPERWLQGVARLTGKPAEMDRLLGSLVVDTTKTQELLGWRPVVSMDQQLHRMATDAAVF